MQHIQHSAESAGQQSGANCTNSCLKPKTSESNELLVTKERQFQTESRATRNAVASNFVLDVGIRIPGDVGGQWWTIRRIGTDGVTATLMYEGGCHGHCSASVSCGEVWTGCGSNRCSSINVGLVWSHAKKARTQVRWKARGPLNSRHNWTFLLSLISGNLSKSAFFQRNGPLRAPISNGRRRRPPTTVGVRKLSDCLLVRYQNIYSASFAIVTNHACGKQTDRQTDRRTDRITTPHYARVWTGLWAGSGLV